MLEDIVENWNNPLNFNSDSPTDNVMKTAAQIYYDGLVKQYVTTQQYTGLRVSSLGKPALETFAKKFHPEWFTGEWKTERMTQLFHNGDTFEADFFMHLHRFDYHVIDTQVEVIWGGVKGHTDMVVNGGIAGVPTLLELKTCACHRFTQMLKTPAAIPMTYRTQLAIYQDVLQIPACWVLYNKDTSDLGVVPFNPNDHNKVLTRAILIIEAYDRLTTWEDVFYEFCAPPPVPEKYKNAQTGLYLIPPDIDKQLAPHIYDIVEGTNGYGKQTKYVMGYLMPDGSVVELGVT